MLQIKNFSIKKSFEPQGGFKENQPQRELSANIGTKENPIYTKIGAGWIKVDSKNVQYLSIALNDKVNIYSKKDGTQVTEHAYTIIKTDDLQKLLQSNVKTGGLTVTDIPYTGEVINPLDIPF